MGFFGFFGKLFSFFKSDAAKRDLEIISNLVPIAMPFVHLAADVTATQSDDKFLSWVNQTLPGFETTGKLTDDVKNNLVRMSVRALVRKANPTLEAPDRIVDSAIQLAYVAFRRQ